jgi:hypothetical protein
MCHFFTVENKCVALLLVVYNKMQVQVDDEIMEWASKNCVLDLLAKLVEGGFVTMQLIHSIDASDLTNLNITKLGD